jgi:agmatinase
MWKMISSSLLLLASACRVLSREITFLPVVGVQHPIFGFGLDDTSLDISQLLSGITTFANLPYVHCLANDGEDVEKYDIAILGA